MEGRTYRYFRGQALFPFGHGLSYTTFEFGNLRVEAAQVPVGGQVTVSVDVTNTGDRSGDEVVQLYVHQRDAAVPCPIKTLKGFKRITLQPGECKTVTFGLHTHQLGSHDEGGACTVQAGTWDVMLGPSSQDLRLEGEFEIVGESATVNGDKVFFSQVQVTQSST